MDPRLKDGVRAHPVVLVAGVLLHAGIAASGLATLAAVTGAAWPNWLRIACAVLSATGAVSGLLLLVRRLREPVLQAISIADDYISNLLVVGVLIAAALLSIVPQAQPVLLLAWAVLAAYAPFGKIRHCVLFFVTRARFGAFIGARGVLVGRSRPS